MSERVAGDDGSGRTVGASPLPSAEQKKSYVRQMFARIARRYDRMNRLMTFGRDRAWRRYAVAQAVRPLLRVPRGRLLDVATGTGDLALEALRQAPHVQVVGVDLVSEMMAHACAKAARAASGSAGRSGSPLHLVQGDALRLPFPDASFDAVVTGFAMRNVTDIPAAFAEMARVTRPGGRVACLEIARPTLPLFRTLYGFYFYRLVPLLGRLVGGETAAYTYLPHSLTAFLTPDQIVAVMQEAGWRDVWYRRLMAGTVAVHVGVRGRGSGAA